MQETCIMPDHTIRPSIIIGQVPFYPDPLIKPPPRLPNIKMYDNRRTTLHLDFDINKDFEVNSPYQEGIILQSYQRPDKSHYYSHQNCRFDQYHEFSTEIFAKTNRHRQILKII